MRLRAAVALIVLASCRLLSQEFEVASLRPADPHNLVVAMSTWPGGKLTVTRFTLRMLIEHAYDVKAFQVSGGPRWIDDDKFDIIAKPPASSESSKLMPKSPKERPTDETLQMLQALLGERFELKIHRETKDGPAFALVVGAKGPKLNPPKDKDDRPLVAIGSTDNPDRPSWMRGYNASMQVFASRLSSTLKTPVIDQTQLTGSYDFPFEYALDDIYRTLQEELGLKLVSIKAPLENLVIDHAAKPSGN